MYCEKCGQELKPNTKFCGQCGVDVNSLSVENIQQPRELSGAIGSDKKVYAEQKKPVVALILSLLIVGVGQFYNGDIKKGGIMLIVAIATGVFSAWVLWVVVSLWSAYDAYNVATQKTPLWV